MRVPQNLDVCCSVVGCSVIEPRTVSQSAFVDIALPGMSVDDFDVLDGLQVNALQRTQTQARLDD
jgi:hypothetical protein